MTDQWIPGSFFDHLDKFSNSLGYDHGDMAVMLSMIPWRTTDERDAFIQSITGRDPAGGTPSTFSDMMHGNGGAQK